MHIQWFPGHMTKALRMMEENARLVDAFVYVLDCRAVRACNNPAFDRFIAGKKVLYVLNKADLGGQAANDAWLKHFTGSGQSAVLTTGTEAGNVRRIRDALMRLTADKIAGYREKGMTKSVRAMVLGIPNTGKSTVINSLCGAKRAATGDKAGVTKGKQWVKTADALELLDTPGTLYPAFDNQETARHLAYLGSINDDILDTEELALELIGELAGKTPELLAARYSLADCTLPPPALYEEICKARGLLLRGGEYDYARCGKIVIDDFRKGRIGRISLELPEEA